MYERLDDLRERRGFEDGSAQGAGWRHVPGP